MTGFIFVLHFRLLQGGCAAQDEIPTHSAPTLSLGQQPPQVNQRLFILWYQKVICGYWLPQCVANSFRCYKYMILPFSFITQQCTLKISIYFLLRWDSNARQKLLLPGSIFLFKISVNDIFKSHTNGNL